MSPGQLKQWRRDENTAWEATRFKVVLFTNSATQAENVNITGNLEKNATGWKQGHSQKKYYDWGNVLGLILFLSNSSILLFPFNKSKNKNEKMTEVSASVCLILATEL